MKNKLKEYTDTRKSFIGIDNYILELRGRYLLAFNEEIFTLYYVKRNIRCQEEGRGGEGV